MLGGDVDQEDGSPMKRIMYSEKLEQGDSGGGGLGNRGMHLHS